MQVRISSTDYEIRVYEDGFRGYEGIILHQEEAIGLCEGKPSFMWGTLWHEILHGILALNGDNELCNDEAFVQRTSNMLYQVIKDNPHILSEEAFKEAIIKTMQEEEEETA